MKDEGAARVKPLLEIHHLPIVNLETFATRAVWAERYELGDSRHTHGIGRER